MCMHILKQNPSHEHGSSDAMPPSALCKTHLRIILHLIELRAVKVLWNCVGHISRTFRAWPVNRGVEPTSNSSALKFNLL